MAEQNIEGLVSALKAERKSARHFERLAQQHHAEARRQRARAVALEDELRGAREQAAYLEAEMDRMTTERTTAR